MQHFIGRFILIALAATGVGQEPAALDRPEWAEMVDQGAIDKRFGGFETLRGLRIELASTDSTVISPLGMQFDPTTGMLFVLEKSGGKTADAIIALSDSRGDG